MVDKDQGSDVAEQVDDLICVVDKVVGSQMDTVLVLLVGWLMFGAVIFLVSHLIYSTLNTGQDTVGSVSASIPTLSVSPPSCQFPVEGNDPDCVRFIQDILQYFISSGPSFRQEIASAWSHKLSHYAKIHTNEEGILLTFKEIDAASLQICLENISVENLQNEKMMMQSDIKMSVEMKVKHSVSGKPRRRSPSSDPGLTDWSLLVENLSGRLTVSLGLRDHSLLATVNDADITLRLNSCIPDVINAQVKSIGEAIKKIASQAIRCSPLDLRTDSFKNFPTFKKSVFQNNAHNQLLSTIGGSKAYTREITGIGQNSCIKTMGVKVVKASNLGSKGSEKKCYVVVELDEPSQRCQTKSVAGPGSVYTWEQNFSVNLTKHSSEILFEIWEEFGNPEKFLGLGIVSISELMSTPSQRHVIPLQGRPYENDQVSGLLTIEFIFKDSSPSWTAGVLPGVHRTFEASENKDNSINKKTIYTRQESSVKGNVSGTRVAEMALKDIIQNKAMKSGEEPSKSTLLMHQVRTMLSPKPGPTISRGDTTSPTDGTDDASDSIGDVSITSKDSDFHKYSRGRKHQRNILSAFRRSFKGTRSLSSHGMSATCTVDNTCRLSPHVRVRSASENRGADLMLCGGGGPRGMLSNNDDGSSLSDVSAISNVSNKTYFTEESSLVLEVYERGRLHHYLIPVQAAKQGKFQKRGTKLHIYMDHIFTAQHIKLGTQCHVCSRLIPLRLGKQAYVCRDCGVTVHKTCHTRVETHCPRTSLDKMELEFYS